MFLLDYRMKIKTKRQWKQDLKWLVGTALLAALLQGAAILLWHWCNRQFMELMLGGGQFAGDPEIWKNQLRRWQILSEAAVLKGYPMLFFGLSLLPIFGKAGKWMPLAALPAGYGGAWLASLAGRLLLKDPAIHVMENLTLARSAARSAALLAAGYLLLYLVEWWKKRRQSQ